MEGTAEVNGVNLWYRSSGEGEPVVQIHGAGFGHSTSIPPRPSCPSTSVSSTTTSG